MTSAAAQHNESSAQAQGGYVVIAIVYLLGLFMGALDTGIVTPGRTVIQNDLGVDDKLGVWVITIYTLAYAAAIPFMGKMADRMGRKPIYLMCVLLFGVGSLMCGLAKVFDSFTFLLVARVVQALGGGGMMPIATAEFGTTFPPEKRGMALGLTGGVYGIASVFGASAGSLVLDIVGTENWQFIFYINVPICLFILAAGIFKLKSHITPNRNPIDLKGTFVLVIMVLSLMYGLRMLDYSDFLGSLTSIEVYPYLLIFLIMLPLFIFVEKRAVDPILNLSYFTNLNIVITLVIGVISGVITMGSVFVPQFAENSLYLPSGKGGYWVILLGVFAGVGAPLSGKIIDKHGVKPVLGFGLVCATIGSLFLAFVAAPHPSLLTVCVSFILIGLGMGFVMGTPVNYMMLDNTDPLEANSALATLSLLRSIGTAVAPAIMVAFLATSGMMVQDRIMGVLPNQVNVSKLPYQTEVQEKLDEYRADPDMAEMLAEAEFPDLAAYTSVEIDMNSDSGEYTVPDDVLEQLKTSDITTIVDSTKLMAIAMFDQIAPDQIAKIENGIDEGIGHIQSAQDEMKSAVAEMRSGMSGIDQGIQGINQGLAAQEKARAQLQSVLPMVQKVENYQSILDFVPASVQEKIPAAVLEQLKGVKTVEDLDKVVAQLDSATAGIKARLAALEASAEQATDEAEKANLEKQIASLKSALSAQENARTMLVDQRPTLSKMQNYSSVLDLMPDSAKSAVPDSVKSQLAQVKTSADLEKMIDDLDDAMAKMRAQIAEMKSAKSQMQQGLTEIEQARGEMTTLIMQLREMVGAIPGAFDEAQDNYLNAIDEKREEIERAFQMTLGEGFTGMFLFVAVCSAVGIVLLILYRPKRPKTHDDHAVQSESGDNSHNESTPMAN